MPSNKDLWKRRIDWCLFFGEVVDIFDEAGCPPADNVGAAHLLWSIDPEHPALEMNPANALASVVLGGFGNRTVGVKYMNAHFSYPETPEEIKEEAVRLAELIKEHRR